MINMSVQARRILSYITVVMILIGAVTLIVLAGCAYHKTDVEEERINKEIVAAAQGKEGGGRWEESRQKERRRESLR